MKINNLYFIVRQYKENSGSYSGFIEQFSKNIAKKVNKITILCLNTNTQKESEELGYASIIRFDAKYAKIPGLGMNQDYAALAEKTKAYFEKKILKKDDIIVANGRAALGVLDKKYILRMGQPAQTFLNNMEIAKKEVSFITRIARYIHFKYQSGIEKQCVINASGYLLPSIRCKKNIEASYNKVLVPFFIPFSGVKPAGKSQTHEKKEKQIMFVAAGHGEKIRKGIVYLEKALPIVFKKYNNIKLIFVGEKDSLNLPGWCKERIVFTGRLDWDKMNEYYHNSDFFLLTSLNEGFPNTLLEAIESGLPVLTSDIDGAEEYITHQISGYIFKRGDIGGLIKGISFMIENPDIIENYAKKASKNIKHLRYSNYSKRLLIFLENFIESHEATNSYNLIKR